MFIRQNAPKSRRRLRKRHQVDQVVMSQLHIERHNVTLSPLYTRDTENKTKRRKFKEGYSLLNGNALNQSHRGDIYFVLIPYM